MAMNNETQQLLKTFWESNEELIRTAVQALAWDGEDDDAQKVLEALNKRNRDYSEYNLNGVGPIKKKKLALEIAKHLVNTQENVDNILHNIERECKPFSIHFLQEKEHYSRNRADILKAHNKEYYINNQWTKKQTDYLIDIVNKEKSLGIEITQR